MTTTISAPGVLALPAAPARGGARLARLVVSFQCTASPLYPRALRLAMEAPLYEERVDARGRLHRSAFVGPGARLETVLDLWAIVAAWPSSTLEIDAEAQDS